MTAMVQDRDSNTPTMPHRSKRRAAFLWWGLIRQGTDFLMYGGILGGTIFGVGLCVWGITASNFSRYTRGVLWGLGAVAGVVASVSWRHHVHQKWRRQTTSPFERTPFHYHCHTALQVGMIVTTTLVFQLVGDGIYGHCQQGNSKDDQATSWDFALLYAQILGCTAVSCRYYHTVQEISGRMHHYDIPRLTEVALVWNHLVAFLLLCQGLDLLTHLTWRKNPWSTPLYLSEAFAGKGVVGRCWATVPPPDNNRYDDDMVEERDP